MLFFHPAFHLDSFILPEHPHERLWPNKLQNRTVPCELVGDFISLHSGMPYFMGNQMTMFVNTASPQGSTRCVMA
jgi:hypothetical protein